VGREGGGREGGKEVVDQLGVSSGSEGRDDSRRSIGGGESVPREAKEQSSAFERTKNEGRRREDAFLKRQLT